MTPYKLVTGGDYNHPVATLGEIVLGKVPSPKGKIQRRWIKGVWLGKLDRDDSNVLGTASGAIAVRSIRRLPKEGQISSELMAAMKGTPWQPRDGVRHKITRELSQPIAFPAPAASGSPEREEAADREHPGAGSGRTQRRPRRPRGTSRGTARGRAGTDAGCGGISRSSGWPRRRQSRSNNASGIRDCRSSAGPSTGRAGLHRPFGERDGPQTCKVFPMNP